MCGVSVPIPPLTDAAMGLDSNSGDALGVVTVTMPPPFAPGQKVILQCYEFVLVGEPAWVSPFKLLVTDTSSVTCALQKCEPSNVLLCQSSIPVPVETSINQATDVSVPPSLLADPSNTTNLSFTAQCADDDKGTPVYRVSDSSQVSCNLFPCQAATFDLCGLSVPVKGGAAMGTAFDLTMPPPFAPDPFTVQCVGSNGRRPAYQLTDHSAVTCQTIPAP
jgi:hypothetical protein